MPDEEQPHEEMHSTILIPDLESKISKSAVTPVLAKKCRTRKRDEEERVVLKNIAQSLNTKTEQRENGTGKESTLFGHYVAKSLDKLYEKK